MAESPAYKPMFGPWLIVKLFLALIGIFVFLGGLILGFYFITLTKPTGSLFQLWPILGGAIILGEILIVGFGVIYLFIRGANKLDKEATESGLYDEVDKAIKKAIDNDPAGIR